MANDGGKGASQALRKNIRRIKSLISKRIKTTSFPRRDHNAHFDALIKEAYKRGYRKAHRTLLESLPDTNIPEKLVFEGKLPAYRGKQTIKFKSEPGKKS